MAGQQVLQGASNSLLVPLAGVAIGGDSPVLVCPLPFLEGQGHPAFPWGLSLAARPRGSSLLCTFEGDLGTS